MTLPDKRIRPSVGAETDSKTFAGVAPSVLLDDVHRGFIAGWDQGYAIGRLDASVDLACEWLHAQACRYAGIARRTATERHGPQWGDTIAQAAEVGQ